MGGRGSSSAGSRSTVISRARRLAERQFAYQYEGWGEGDSINERIPSWVVRKNSSATGHLVGASVVRETEKGYLIDDGMSKYGGRPTRFWVAKSVLQSPAKTKAEILESLTNQYVSDFYSSYLRNLAKSSGVKIGNISSWDKITAKLKKSGVAVMSRHDYKLSRG